MGIGFTAGGGGVYDYVDNVEPSNPSAGEVWLDTSQDPPAQKVFADVGSGIEPLLTQSDSRLDAKVSEAIVGVPAAIEVVADFVVAENARWRLPSSESTTVKQFTVDGLYENAGDLSVESDFIVNGETQVEAGGTIEVSGDELLGDGLVSGEGTISDAQYTA